MEEEFKMSIENEPEQEEQDIAPRPYTARVSARARRRMRGTQQQSIILSRIFAQAFGGAGRGGEATARIRFMREEEQDQDESSSDDNEQELRTYQVPNEWQELDEEEESDGGQELMSTYGPFSVILYARVKKLKLFEVSDASAFLEKFTAFYTKNVQEMSKSEAAMKNIKSLVSMLPSVKRFTRLLSFHRLRGRDMVFFKLALDIMTFYYKSTEAPLFSKLQKEVIPLALRFYKSLAPQTLKEISTELLSCISHKKEKDWLLLLKTKRDFLRYYRTELIELQNLTGGNDIQTYYV